MIESNNPQIDVEQLMQRVRREAANVRARGNGAAAAAPVAAAPAIALPPLGDLPSPPPFGSSGPLELKKERLDGLLKQAREMTEAGRGIPKFLRGLFRKQGGYNRALLDAVASLAKTNLQLNKRVQELQAAAQQHHDWIEILTDRRRADADWMKTATPVISGFNVLQAGAQQTARLQGEHDGWLRNLQAQADGAGEHLRNLQGDSDRKAHALRDLREESARSGEHLRNLQTQVDTSGEHLRNLQRTAEQLLALYDQNERAAEHLRNLQVQVDRQSDFLQGLRGDTDRHGEHLRHLQDTANTSGEHLRNLQDEADRAVEQLRDLAPVRVTTARLEAEIAHLSDVRQMLLRLEERQASDAVYLKGQLAHHAALLQQSLGVRGKKTTARKTAQPAGDLAPATDLDAFYVSFENRFRGTRAEIKERVRHYLPALQKAKAGTAARPILDVGCGRGEWLELLRENKLRASGVDLNSAMVAECVTRGFDAAHADAIAHLRSLPDESHGCVSGFHIIEHLPFETLLELFMQTRRVLKPGGMAIFESPNCKNLMVGACYFNVDPTHRNPVFPETAGFIMEMQGFSDVRLEYLSPAARPFTNGDHDAELLNDFLFGPQDFAVIGYKPAA